MRNPRILLAIFICLLFAIIGCANSSDDPTIPDNSGNGDDNQAQPVTVYGNKADALCVAQFNQLSPNAIESVGGLRLYYGHTSHGSQLITGLDMIENFDPLFSQPTISEPGGDLGHNGSLTWETTTRAYLADYAQETDVVIWSWCGGASDNTLDGIDIYLNAMNQLEIDFPDIIFIYMTGHLDGTGVDGNLYANNNRIRNYCDENQKWLYDFADIESYDPAGNYYPDEDDSCDWCEDWCAGNDCLECNSCAHSHCFNCWQKGKAFWWLLGRIVGWQG
ncbi:MAG: hypothetical protein GY780_18985 [bacterium]|nr:hypothetical protein [bacterium]